ncbi:hypothetical protein [Actinacidiphila glaucinigra]|nr:hypothetical protein [Actinacidiphila glaucinigra]
MGTAVSVRRERCAVFTVGYLRVAGVVDLLGAGWSRGGPAAVPLSVR